ncbi:hypothetical protein Taro_007678 [Colocasia esculenta]|uniref:Uncharacterized protein n=1 Tax=Colocasia esculenta TaxID=4460 RepID=A0A843U142_COLES|nr:hypothetical protein [Colocasia esculenta]
MLPLSSINGPTMASRGRRGGAPAREDEPRRDDPAPQGPVLPPLPPVDYGVFMQGLVQAMQTQAHTQTALQAQLEAQMKDFDAILGLDWLEEHYALVDCRRKRIVFRIPGEDEFSHPLPRNWMKDFDAILGLDWLEEHYALVDCRRKRIVFRIPGEDEFSHSLPRNWVGKLVISAMKAMRMKKKKRWKEQLQL